MEEDGAVFGIVDRQVDEVDAADGEGFFERGGKFGEGGDAVAGGTVAFGEFRQSELVPATNS